MHRRFTRGCVDLICCLLLAGPLLAGGGRFEINQACALNTGCFAGDSAGFPVTIGNPGSYLLTGNLTVPTEDDTGVTVVATNGVTLDLGGHEIAGPVTCSGEPVTSCSAAGTFGNGVTINNSDNVTVLNGSVRGMGNNGINVVNASKGVRIERLQIAGNSKDGIYAGGSSIIIDNVVMLNGEDGIQVLDFGSLIRGNAVRGNNTVGIHADYARVADNAVQGNGSHGIQIPTGTSMIIGNHIIDNGGWGIAGMSWTGYADNQISFNTLGTAAGVTEIGTNMCNGDTTCP